MYAGASLTIVEQQNLLFVFVTRAEAATGETDSHQDENHRHVEYHHHLHTAQLLITAVQYWNKRIFAISEFILTIKFHNMI